MAHQTVKSGYTALVDRLNRFPQGAPPCDVLYETTSDEEVPVWDDVIIEVRDLQKHFPISGGLLKRQVGAVEGRAHRLARARIDQIEGVERVQARRCVPGAVQPRLLLYPDELARVGVPATDLILNLGIETP